VHKLFEGAKDVLAKDKVWKTMKAVARIDPVISKATEQKFSIAKVAELIRVHVSTVSRLMDSGKLGYYQIGRRRIVGEGHLEHYLSVTERRAKGPSAH
jgi:excisionase family DNA binding protein